MVGGMHHRGGGVPLAARVRADPSGPSPVAAPELCPVRHCWVAAAVDDTGVKRPGLLVEWRRTAHGWDGRVVYAARLRSGGWALVEEWLPAECLAPADPA